MGEAVWFIGPWQSPGYYLRLSTEPGKSAEPNRGGKLAINYWHKPPEFPWPSMDREWSAAYKPQGTTGMDYAEDWSVLSVADRTVDSRPNVLVAFAVQRAEVSEAEMRALAEERYPSVWKRLGVVPRALEHLARVELALGRLRELDVPEGCLLPVEEWLRSQRAEAERS